MREPDLRGKTALVTGGGRGLGRATALALGRCGARVIVTARRTHEIESAAQEIERAGGEALAVPCDVANEDLVRTLFEAAGPVDILITSAGIIQPIAPVVQADPAAWSHNIAVNLKGVFLTCHYALPHMLQRGWGRIINVSSGSARGSTTGWSAYSAAKAGVEALTKVLAAEVGVRGVHANACRPGIIDTEMQVEIRAATEEQFGRENVARFHGYRDRGLLRPPEEPARLILWLLTPDADDVNGEVVVLDEAQWASRADLVPSGR